MTKYEAVIGLEVHVQLKTNTKLFCGCSIRFGDEPNENTCPICLGMPGVLPVLNKKALEYAVKLGHALNCPIAELSKFDRKQYFYPDLPKGYQISQYDRPVCQEGYLELSNGKKVRIERAHLEEDAGKLVHSGADGLAGSDYSLVDLNRAGTPLLEVVSMPDIRSSDEAQEYVSQLRSIVRYLDVCDGNLEEGSMRCDANVSIRPRGQEELGTKAEIKNMNSLKAMKRAIDVEIERQIGVVEGGNKVVQESRLWNEATGKTISMRSKEEAHDYRYFPDPDLRPLAIDAAWVKELKDSLPELPSQRYEKLTQTFGLPEYDAGVLVEFKELGDFFMVASETVDNYKGLSNWLMGDIAGYLNANKKLLEDTKLTPEHLAQFVKMIDDGALSSAQAKKLLPDLLESGEAPETLAKAKGMAQISDDGALKEILQKILDENPDNVAAYRGGKDKLFGFFVGQAMKATQGNANPQKLNELLKELLQG
ncbi:MAG: Asp-tRNA(Asn)/Glu-tRNA(Gln) amidotransferase subunit GatB [Vampirovibrio sp.]|nr:Asp-tRNA(Asn)/Glu-tRNA(Gln) amidotransferase subunit GatB [Vampirovibrio sp.]